MMDSMFSSLIGFLSPIAFSYFEFITSNKSLKHLIYSMVGLQPSKPFIFLFSNNCSESATLLLIVSAATLTDIMFASHEMCFLVNLFNKIPLEI